MNKRRLIPRREALKLLTLLGVAILATACAKKPRYILQLPSEVAPPIVYCFETVGHNPGSKPWILGGTCCCTPSQEVLEDYKKHGHVPLGMTLDDLIALYAEKGIQTALDHRGCNNMCIWGPHVVKGGKCMVPPTPLTQNYEEVFSGRFEKPDEIQLEKMARQREKRITRYVKQRGKL